MALSTLKYHKVANTDSLNVQWVIAKLDVTTKVIWVLQAKNEAEVSVALSFQSTVVLN
jgi:hypothetical protein